MSAKQQKKTEGEGEAKIGCLIPASSEVVSEASGAEVEVSEWCGCARDCIEIGSFDVGCVWAVARLIWQGKVTR